MKLTKDNEWVEYLIIDREGTVACDEDGERISFNTLKEAIDQRDEMFEMEDWKNEDLFIVKETNEVFS